MRSLKWEALFTWIISFTLHHNLMKIVLLSHVLGEETLGKVSKLSCCKLVRGGAGEQA